MKKANKNHDENHQTKKIFFLLYTYINYENHTKDF